MIKSRSKFLTTLCLALVTCVCFAIGCFTLTKVNADEPTETPTVHVETILMDEGAQVRFKSAQGEHADKSGIRFTLYVNQQHYHEDFTNPVVGIYVARESDLTTELDMSTPAKAPANAKHFIARSVEELSGDEAETIQETYSLKGVLYGAPEEEYGEKLVANGYIKEADADISTVNFQGEAQTRSIAQVASAILANGSETDASNISDLKEYVDKFTAVQANFTMDTAVRTDMYRTAEPTLNVQNPAGLVATWDSSNKDVATVDADGNITRVGKGETDITATVGNKTITSKLTIADPAPLIVDENTYKNAYTYDGATYFSSFVDKDSEELADFTGDYHGNATKFRFNSGHNYWLINDYTTEALDEFELAYTKVILWFAVDNIESGNLLLMENRNAFSNKAFPDEGRPNAPGRHYLTSENNKVWQKWEITPSEYIALATGGYVDGSKLLFHAYTENAKALDNTLITFYIGDIQFVFDPYIVKVSENTYTKIYTSDDRSWNTFVSAGADEIKEFTGDYSGAAVRLKDSTNGNFRFDNNFTAESLTYLKEKGLYSSVSLYLSHNTFTGTSRFYGASTKETFITKAGLSGSFFIANPTASHHLACNTWHKITISIDDYISLINGTSETSKGYIPLYTKWFDSTVATEEKWAYVGDIFLE